MAKFAWRKQSNKKVQYVLDDGSTVLFDVDGEQFNEADYDVSISANSMSNNLRESLKQLAHAGLQNGLLNFSQLLDILTTDSISSIKRKMQRAEEDGQKRAQEAENNKIKMQQEEIKARKEEADKLYSRELEKLGLEHADNQKERDNKVTIKQMEIDSKSKEADNKANVENNKISIQQLIEQQKLVEQARANKEKESIEKKKIEQGKSSK